MVKIIEMISEDDILEDFKITEVKFLMEDIELAKGIIILEEVEVGPVKGGIQVALGEIIEAVLDQDLVLE